MDKTIITSEGYEPTEKQLRTIETAVHCALKAEAADERYASIVLTNDELIHIYNREYRNVDRATDVLSFPADEGDDLVSPPDGFLGDIMISVPRAEQQGKELGHSTERELAFLAVHGILHLLGYDHIDPKDEKLMLSRQREIMASEELKALDEIQTMNDEGNTMNAIDNSEIEKMIDMAKEARERAYARYSHFRVGACLKAASGKYYLGCNIENASYTPTVCAERTAVFKAVFEGEREFSAIAIISDSTNYTSPCGVCRQVLAEFCNKNMPVILANKTGEYKCYTLGDLIPLAFTSEDMDNEL